LVDWVDNFDERGYQMVRGLFPQSACDALLGDLESCCVPGANRRGGARLRLSQTPRLRAAATRSAITEIASAVLGAPCFPVRALFFDKTIEANWKVTWHQDVTIAVKREKDAPGFGPWTEKSGIVHVQPPANVLERMVAARLHLDDCCETNGPLRVIPGSHKAGRLSMMEIAAWRETAVQVACTARRGDVLLLRPLLLHASSAAITPAHRRVLHVEYASLALPNGLEWFERCA
jgi:ectoine hydroxylase-related dioxygenase (phytanoyl-CoA dioxygenase family)